MTPKGTFPLVIINYVPRSTSSGPNRSHPYRIVTFIALFSQSTWYRTPQKPNTVETTPFRSSLSTQCGRNFPIFKQQYWSYPPKHNFPRPRTLFVSALLSLPRSSMDHRRAIVLLSSHSACVPLTSGVEESLLRPKKREEKNISRDANSISTALLCTRTYFLDYPVRASITASH